MVKTQKVREKKLGHTQIWNKRILFLQFITEINFSNIVMKYFNILCLCISEDISKVSRTSRRSYRSQGHRLQTKQQLIL